MNKEKLKLSVKWMNNGLSFRKKSNRHWLWYAYDTRKKKVLAYIGSRTDKTCQKLLNLLAPFKIGLFATDDWGSYGRKIDIAKHLTGKIHTQRIERCNLNLRTRIKRLARKTICFSRSKEMHEKVIGTYIEKCLFN